MSSEEFQTDPSQIIRTVEATPESEIEPMEVETESASSPSGYGDIVVSRLRATEPHPELEEVDDPADFVEYPRRRFLRGAFKSANADVREAWVDILIGGAVSVYQFTIAPFVPNLSGSGGGESEGPGGPAEQPRDRRGMEGEPR